MQYKIAIEMIQEVVEGKDADDVEKTTVDGNKEEGEVTGKHNAKLTADDFLRQGKR